MMKSPSPSKTSSLLLSRRAPPPPLPVVGGVLLPLPLSPTIASSTTRTSTTTSRVVTRLRLLRWVAVAALAAGGVAGPASFLAGSAAGRWWTAAGVLGEPPVVIGGSHSRSSTGEMEDKNPHHHHHHREGSSRRLLLRTDDTDQVQWTSFQDIPDETDFYSASWIMPVQRFMEVDTSFTGIQGLEDGVFAAFGGRDHLLRMSLDFLDWSVEHLSHWWRLVGVPHNDAGYQFTVQKLASYISRHAPTPSSSDDASFAAPPYRGLNSTVAVVAFAPVRSEGGGDHDGPTLNATELARRDRVMTIASLGATLASLVRVGVGRVVVVGSDPAHDRNVVHQAFQQLVVATRVATAIPEDGLDEDWFELLWYPRPDDDDDSGRVVRVGETDLTFAGVTPDMVNSTYEQNNVPRGTLVGLQRAFHQTDAHWTQAWLGLDPSKWKYVYYSEADTLLQTRPSVMRHLFRQLDDGLIVAPHRLQLIPYEGDVPNYHQQSQARLVPTDFKTPVLLNSGEVVFTSGDNNVVDNHTGTHLPMYQYCCDPLEGDYRPGRSDYPHCGTFWYRCGWNEDEKNRGNHSRLVPYEFVRLSGGTGITTLAGTEHGRRCHPSVVPCSRNRATKGAAAPVLGQQTARRE